MRHLLPGEGGEGVVQALRAVGFVPDGVACNGNPVVVSASTTNVSCNGGNDGAINVTVTGGATPYTYAWSNSVATEDISGLTADTYTLVVTDGNGSKDTLEVVEFLPNEPQPSVNEGVLVL